MMTSCMAAALMVLLLSMVAILVFPCSDRLPRGLYRLASEGAVGPYGVTGSRTLGSVQALEDLQAANRPERTFALFLMRRLSSRQTNGEGLNDSAMMLELIAAMLDSGAGLGRALELIAAGASPRLAAALRPVVAALAIGVEWDTAWRSSAAPVAQALELKEALGFAALTGAPSSSILYTQAARIRRENFRAAERKAAALGVRLVIPLGLCSLPAFICLGVLPVLLGMLPAQ